MRVVRISGLAGALSALSPAAGQIADSTTVSVGVKRDQKEEQDKLSAMHVAAAARWKELEDQVGQGAGTPAPFGRNASV